MVPLTQSDLIPVAAEVGYAAMVTIPLIACTTQSPHKKLGFEFHHTKPDLVTMTCWLPDKEASTLPIFATHNIGEQLTEHVL